MVASQPSGIQQITAIRGSAWAYLCHWSGGAAAPPGSSSAAREWVIYLTSFLSLRYIHRGSEGKPCLCHSSLVYGDLFNISTESKAGSSWTPCQQDMDDTLFPQRAADQSINKDQRIKAESTPGGSHTPGQEEELWEVCRQRLVSPEADSTCPATNSAPLLPGSSNNSFYNPCRLAGFYLSISVFAQSWVPSLDVSETVQWFIWTQSPGLVKRAQPQELL